MEFILQIPFISIKLMTAFMKQIIDWKMKLKKVLIIKLKNLIFQFKNQKSKQLTRKIFLVAYFRIDNNQIIQILKNIY